MSVNLFPQQAEPDYALNVWLGGGGESTGRGKYGRKEGGEKRVEGKERGREEE